MKLTDQQIAENVKSKIKEIDSEIEEVFELFEDWKPEEEWHNTLGRLRAKKYLLMELIGEE